MTEVGADRGGVAAREHRSRACVARGGGSDHRPAGLIGGSGHLRSAAPAPFGRLPNSACHSCLEHWPEELTNRSVQFVDRTPNQLIGLCHGGVRRLPACWRWWNVSEQRMRSPKLEGLLERRAQLRRIERPGAGQQGDIGQVFDPRVGARARQCVGVQLLRDVRYDRIEAEPGRFDVGKRQQVADDDLVRFADERIAEADVDAERAAEDLAGEAALGGEAVAGVLMPSPWISGWRRSRCTSKRMKSERSRRPAAWSRSSSSVGVPVMRRSTSFVVRARASRSSSTRPPLRIAASPTSRCTRARNRSNTSSCRRRAMSTPDVDSARRRCSSACLKAWGVAYRGFVTTDSPGRSSVASIGGLRPCSRSGQAAAPAESPAR